MRDADLDDRAARRAELDEQLGREERAARLDADRPRAPRAGRACRRSRRRSTLSPKKIRFGQAVGPGVERPDERIGALDPIADDDVRLVGCRHPVGQPAEVRDPELAIAVGEGHEVVAGRPKARAEGGAIAEVRRMVDRADDTGVGGGQPSASSAVAVARAVVDDDDLERLGERRQGVERLGDQRLDVGLLVVGREEVGQLGDARSAARRRRRVMERPREGPSTRATISGPEPPRGWAGSAPSSDADDLGGRPG